MSCVKYYRKYIRKGCGKDFKSAVKADTCKDCYRSIRVFAETLVLDNDSENSRKKLGVKPIRSMAIRKL